ncbi:MAG: hypothetical protein KDJ65_34285 [Anaerolineae bacterium]|nr:hypothetical protein [Anaerolineae bacterium]
MRQAFDHSIQITGETFEIYRKDGLISEAKGVKNSKESYIAFYPQENIEIGDRLKGVASNQTFWVIDIDSQVIEDKVVKVKVYCETDPQHNRRITSEGQNTSHTVINLPGNFQGAILNVNSTLNNVNQVIDSTSHIDQPEKDQLKSLIQELNKALQSVPSEKAEEAEAVAETAQTLIETATKDKPNKAMIKITAEGLKQAARNIADIMPPVLTIATEITSVIYRLIPPNAG